MTAIAYIGARPPLVKAFGGPDGRTGHVSKQVVDIVGIDAPSFDQIEERGIIGPFEGSKPRQILISREEWQEMKLRRNMPLDR